MIKAEIEDFSPELYNTSDVVFTMKDGRRRNEVVLIATADSSFNLIKYYLSLKAFVEKIERELEIMEEADEIQ